ncbi:hypothetical protein ACEQ8H_007813 [Pleosporales sp. CAS-2024a]
MGVLHHVLLSASASAPVWTSTSTPTRPGPRHLYHGYHHLLIGLASYGAAPKAIQQSVKECGLGYMDLFLLHSPYGGTRARLDGWRAVEDAIQVGEVRIGGVGNYRVKHASLAGQP